MKQLKNYRVPEIWTNWDIQNRVKQKYINISTHTYSTYNCHQPASRMLLARAHAHTHTHTHTIPFVPLKLHNFLFFMPLSTKLTSALLTETSLQPDLKNKSRADGR